MNIYPRLRKADAQAALARLESIINEDRPIVPFEDGAHHPKAEFPLIDGVPVSISRLRELRSRLEIELPRDLKSRNSDRQFDVIVGRVLDAWFEEEGRAVASHPDTWPYLTLIVLPDYAVRRYPAQNGRLSSERFLGGRRNVFHRAYLRSWILGPLLHDNDLGLFEDELVSLVDRSLSANHELSRRVAQNLGWLSINKEIRRAVARQSFIDLQFELRVTDLASLPEEAMNSIVDEIFEANRQKHFSSTTQE